MNKLLLSVLASATLMGTSAFAMQPPMGFEDLPMDTKAYFFSFLPRKDLLRAGDMSPHCKEIAKKVWENRPLKLCYRPMSANAIYMGLQEHRDEQLYNAIKIGPFSHVIFATDKLNSTFVEILSQSPNLKSLTLMKGPQFNIEGREFNIGYPKQSIWVQPTTEEINGKITNYFQIKNGNIKLTIKEYNKEDYPKDKKKSKKKRNKNR